MKEIIGGYNTAKCFTDTVEDNAIEQIQALCDHPDMEGTVIRIMPDVHAGKGCTIGTTVALKGKVSPFAVGVDIGCGMYTLSLGKGDIDLEAFDEAAHYIPSGHGVWEGRQERFDLSELRCFRHLKDSKRLVRSLGTLGGGNHFIEIDEDGEGNRYLVIHSGSRNLGVQVAEHYQNIAVELAMGKEEYYKRRNALIEQYKAEGRRAEIQAALKELDREFARESKNSPAVVMPELCCLYGEFLDDYIHDIDICRRFAARSRELMAEILTSRVGIQGFDGFHTIHNYIDTENMILRKGAISAGAGERMLIPINMRDGSLICIGKGNADWNYSAPHGAGRLLSRTDALLKLTMAEYEREMSGIYTTSVQPDTLDEAPMAYKSMDEIMRNIQPTAEIVSVIKPIYNFKGG